MNENGKSFQEMEEDELRDLMDDDPKGFVEGVTREMRSTLEADARQGAMEETIEKFASRHPDFDQMWDAGKIQEFVKDNPGHNAMSAYLVLKKKSGGFISKANHEKAVKQEIEKDRLKGMKGPQARSAIMVSRLRDRRKEQARHDDEFIPTV